MPKVTVSAAVYGVRYACDAENCSGEMLVRKDIPATGLGGFVHQCSACLRRTQLDRAYPTYDIRVQPLEELH